MSYPSFNVPLRDNIFELPTHIQEKHNSCPGQRLACLRIYLCEIFQLTVVTKASNYFIAVAYFCESYCKKCCTC